MSLAELSREADRMGRDTAKHSAPRAINMERIMRRPKVQRAMLKASERAIDNPDRLAVQRKAAELSLPRAEEAWLRECFKETEGHS